MNIEIDKILNIVESAKVNEMPQWKIDLLAARKEIVCKLLVYTYHAMGLSIPSDEVIVIRASQIAEKAEVSNRELKNAFFKALDVKMEKDIRTPITYGDVERGARMVADERGTTIQGKWKNALPEIADKELWGENVCLFAASFGKKEFEALTKGAIAYER